MASNKPVIAVVGATGAQGSGLVRAILQDPERRFTARAITRKPDSDRARALAAQGAEVVAADADDAPSLDRAFAGATARSASPTSGSTSRRSGRSPRPAPWPRAAAAPTSGTWSGPRSRTRAAASRSRTTGCRRSTGRYKVPHFDGKGEADAVFAEAGVPTTLLLTSFYWDNLIHFGMGPRKDATAQLVFTLPMGDRKLPGIAAEDIGRCAYGVFARGQEMIGRTVGIAGEHLTGSEMAAELSHGARSAGRATTVPSRLPQARLPRRGRPREHVPVQARLRARVLRRPSGRSGALAVPGTPDLPAVARAPREGDPPELTADPARQRAGVTAQFPGCAGAQSPGAQRSPRPRVLASRGRERKR